MAALRAFPKNIAQIGVNFIILCKFGFLKWNDVVHWCRRWISGSECITSKSSELQSGCLWCDSLSAWDSTWPKAARLNTSLAGSVMWRVKNNKSLWRQLSLNAFMYQHDEAKYKLKPVQMLWRHTTSALICICFWGFEQIYQRSRTVNDLKCWLN